MPPSVSVIVPCYNGARYLRQAIDCVLGQTRLAHELIVVDDGSTDDSAAIASSYGPQVQLIRQENRGEGAARNTGAKAATGSHLFFLDADDLIERDALERLGAAAAANPDAMVLMKSVPFDHDSGQPTAEPWIPPAEFFPTLIRTCLGVPHAWLTPAKVYRQTRGFSTTLKYFVDWEFWCQAALLEPPLVTLPYVGALYRRHPQAMSSNTPTVNRVRGHVAVMQTLVSGLAGRPHLLELCGADLFWCSWVAVNRAREAGVPWDDLRSLAESVTALVRKNPAKVQAGAMARAVRWFGFRGAYHWHSFLNKIQTLRPRLATARATVVGGEGT